ncbi:related to DNA repair protein RAD33 [Saccharomycodes ludwigii]|uniref:Related to DNA repair protein RAD33 n=1 Tax=Saccharomycodes ludwigii TaxID=36035 RepID=A0A376B3G8_9ASCO|nr:hypothetical protein SCDLUD_003317 [Saccharomycodes ludwigii]KAH3900343.1 hypothetical protein SCDLUD_003317 [Saccharomycodes ludwigii]SSD59238.1 related to DNA repair protein RAD33 [Saccharomycodes ludwigii]
MIISQQPSKTYKNQENSLKDTFSTMSFPKKNNTYKQSNNKRSNVIKDYSRVEKFLNPTNIPPQIEDEILNLYLEFSLESDMLLKDLSSFFECLSLPAVLYNKINYQNELCIENTQVVDFNRLLQVTYHLLIYVDNEPLIMQYWKLLVDYSQRKEQPSRFAEIEYKNQILGIKELQKINESINAHSITNDEDTNNQEPQILIKMLQCATRGKRSFITYIDFANLLGRIGLLRMLE